MESNMFRKPNRKRKLEDDDSSSPKGNKKKILIGLPNESQPIGKSKYFAQNRLNNIRNNNRLQNNINRTQHPRNASQSNQPQQENDSTEASPYTNMPTQYYSANGRLKSLRKKLQNNLQSHNWFSTDERYCRVGSNSIQDRVKKPDKDEQIPQLNYTGFRVSSVQRKAFQPFRPIGRSTTPVADDAQTECDESESVADFGRLSPTPPLILRRPHISQQNDAAPQLNDTNREDYIDVNVESHIAQTSNVSPLQGLNNSHARFKPYSINNRLKDVRACNSRPQSYRQPSQDVDLLILPEPTRTATTGNEDFSFNSDIPIFNLSNFKNVQQKSPIKEPAWSSLFNEHAVTPSSRIPEQCNATQNLSLLNVSNEYPVRQASNFLENDNDVTAPPFNRKDISLRIAESSRSSLSYLDDNLDEPMEWTTINESEILTTLQDFRKSVIESEEITHIPQTMFQETVAKISPEMEVNRTILKDIYVVVDTNIFISHLRIVKQILDVKINGVETPIIMIPWMVIQELDYIKDGRSGETLRNKAHAAIRFINYKLTHKDPYVKGQSVIDAAAQNFSSNNPDDAILHCCLQIIKKRNKVTLLSNDVNLRNKVLLHDIPACGHNKIIHELDPYHPRTNDNFISNTPKEDGRIKELKTYLSETCNIIVLELLKQDYGAVWEKLHPTSASSKWSLEKCIEMFNQYWLPVFSLHLPKHCGKTLEKFQTFLKTRRNGIIPLEDGEKLLDFSLSLCVYLKNSLPQYKNLVESCINKIHNVCL